MRLLKRSTKFKKFKKEKAKPPQKKNKNSTFPKTMPQAAGKNFALLEYVQLFISTLHSLQDRKTFKGLLNIAPPPRETNAHFHSLTKVKHFTAVLKDLIWMKKLGVQPRPTILEFTAERKTGAIAMKAASRSP